MNPLINSIYKNIDYLIDKRKHFSISYCSSRIIILVLEYSGGCIDKYMIQSNLAFQIVSIWQYFLRHKIITRT